MEKDMSEMVENKYRISRQPLYPEVKYSVIMFWIE